MADRAVRGMTIGSKSMESEDNVEFAAHQNITFVCDLGHVTVIPMAIEADIPPTWECSNCGNQALLRGGDEPEAEEPKKTPRTHWDMLLERRSIEELEVVLSEQLTAYREGRLRPEGSYRKG